MSHDGFVKYPTGAIEKDGWCENCKSFNNRRVTCSVITMQDSKVLLVKRALDPEKGAWALPGGYLFYGETVEECAEREFEEESGYELEELELLGVFSDPKRDQDGRENVDCCFVGKVGTKVGGSDHEVELVEWFELNKLPEKIAFDHRKMIEKAAKLQTS